MEPHFGCNPDCFDYERNAMIMILQIKKHLLRDLDFIFSNKAKCKCNSQMFLIFRITCEQKIQ